MEKIEGFLKKIRRLVDEEIINYVDEKMIPLDNKLEQAINLYLLLGNVLKYNEQYDFYRDYRKTLGFVNVNLLKNYVICSEWATIYVKLLKRYGIKAKVVSEEAHYYVALEIDNITYVADATIYGVWDHQYFLSDLTNIKSGFKIKQFSLISGSNPLNEFATEREKEDLENTILKVYQKTNRKIIPDERIKKIVDSVHKRIKNNTGIVGKFSADDINYRLALLQRLKGINSVNTPVEKKQLINKLGEQVFFDVKRSNYKSLTLCNLKNEIVYYKLFIITDENNVYYFLETDDSFLFFGDTNLLLDELLERNLGIKREDCFSDFADGFTKKLQIRY